MRDGKSFAARRVDAIQDSQVVFTLTASFQREEAWLEHQNLMSQTLGPEGLIPRLLDQCSVDGRSSFQWIR
jgi:acyl-CoA thioesterase-2